MYCIGRSSYNLYYIVHLLESFTKCAQNQKYTRLHKVDVFVTDSL